MKNYWFTFGSWHDEEKAQANYVVNQPDWQWLQGDHGFVVPGQAGIVAFLVMHQLVSDPVFFPFHGRDCQDVNDHAGHQHSLDAEPEKDLPWSAKF